MEGEVDCGGEAAVAAEGCCVMMGGSAADDCNWLHGGVKSFAHMVLIC